MRRSASFFIGLILVAGSFLLLPSFSYAQKSESQVSVSTTVQEHITYYKRDGQILVQTNLKNKTVTVEQENQKYIVVSF